MSFPVAFLAEVETRSKGIHVDFRRAKAIDGLTQIAALTLFCAPEDPIVDRVARNQIVVRFYFQEIARNVISLQALSV